MSDWCPHCGVNPTTHPHQPLCEYERFAPPPDAATPAGTLGPLLTMTDGDLKAVETANGDDWDNTAIAALLRELHAQRAQVAALSAEVARLTEERDGWRTQFETLRVDMGWTPSEQAREIMHLRGLLDDAATEKAALLQRAQELENERGLRVSYRKGLGRISAELGLDLERDTDIDAMLHVISKRAQEHERLRELFTAEGLFKVLTVDALSDAAECANAGRWEASRRYITQAILQGVVAQKGQG